MKVFRYLTILALLMAGVAGYLYWQTYHYALRSDAAVAIGVAGIKEDFQSKVNPTVSLSLEELQQSRASKELNDPGATVPQIHQYSFEEISSLVHYAKTCQSNGVPKINTQELRKALAWHQFLCGRNSSLPQNFFSTPPFMHPSGASYYWLAVQSGRAEFTNPLWKKQNSSTMHLLEALRDKSIGGGILISSWELQNLLQGESIVFSNKHVFLKSKPTNTFNPIDRYNIFSRAEWDQFTKKADFIASEQVDSPACLYQESNLCWKQNSENNLSKTRTIASFLFISFLILAATVMGGAYRRLQQRKKDTAQRLFTLQMLTHELRTPATSLRLSIETFRREFDSLPKDSQKAFLTICEELQRLDRVVEASKSYLKSEGTLQLSNKSNRVSVSANQLVSTVLEVYDESVKFVPLREEYEISIDRYWAELCIKNLVDNALLHGKPPITVSLTKENDSLVIAVEDKGSVSFSSLDEMLEPFCKGESSRGLGLGLAIVQKVVSSMNGELGFKTMPTTFYIKLRGRA